MLVALLITVLFPKFEKDYFLVCLVETPIWIILLFVGLFIRNEIICWVTAGIFFDTLLGVTALIEETR